MRYDTIDYKKEKGIVIINVLAHPVSQKKKERLSVELYDVCAKILSDKKILLTLLTGSNKDSFSIESITTAPDSVNIDTGSSPLNISDSIAGLDMPVIAAVNGNVSGPGMEIILACDIRIASETSSFSFPCIKDGRIPQGGGTQRLPRLIGRAGAMEMLLTGEPINAKEAKKKGLVSRIVPDGELLSHAKEMARKIVSKGPIALKYAKEAVNKGLDMTLSQGLQLEADLYYLLHTTEDRTEGIKAFRDKREPDFKGK